MAGGCEGVPVLACGFPLGEAIEYRLRIALPDNACANGEQRHQQEGQARRCGPATPCLRHAAHGATWV